MPTHQPTPTPAPAAEVLACENGSEVGGLSGPILMEPSTQVLADMYKLTGGAWPALLFPLLPLC